ncbi:MAG: BMP family protein [Acidimicrobiales bacterium]
MKQSWRLLVALFLVFALVAAACGDDEEEADTSEPAADDGGDEAGDGGDEAGDGGDEGASECGPGGVEAPQSSVAGTSSGDGSALTIGLVHNGRGDGSFNDSAVAGLDAAVADFGITPQEVVVNLTGGETGATEVETLAQSGTDYNVLVGFLLADAAAAAATSFPDAQFGIIDSVVDAPNVQGLVFAEEQGSFLVGVAAALCSQSGTVGFIGGVQNELIGKFEAGFVAGATAANPDINVEVAYITQPPDFSGFGDPVRAKEIALAQLEAGADVIYAAAGGSGNGMFEAIAEANEAGEYAWAIGVDSDQAAADIPTVPNEVKPYILTSMLKRVDIAVYNTVDAVVNGTYTPGGVNVFDLSNDAVGYSTTGGLMSQGVIDQIEDFKAQIVAGDIEVPAAP